MLKFHDYDVVVNQCEVKIGNVKMHANYWSRFFSAVQKVFKENSGYDLDVYNYNFYDDLEVGTLVEWDDDHGNSHVGVVVGRTESESTVTIRDNENNYIRKTNEIWRYSP